MNSKKAQSLRDAIRAKMLAGSPPYSIEIGRVDEVTQLIQDELYTAGWISTIDTARNETIIIIRPEGHANGD